MVAGHCRTLGLAGGQAWRLCERRSYRHGIPYQGQAQAGMQAQSTSSTLDEFGGGRVWMQKIKV
jgi:hypothetical protein